MHFVTRYVYAAVLAVLITLVALLSFRYVMDNWVNYDPSYVRSFNDSSRASPEAVLEEVLKAVQCKDGGTFVDRATMRIKDSFTVIYNFVRATRKFGCHESVTYTTAADFRFLDSLEFLVGRWKGPVSVALYAPGDDDFVSTVESIAYLRRCLSPEIEELVTFHMFFETFHAPEDLESINKFFFDSINCSSSQAPWFTRSNIYRSRNHLLFPINLGRNIAREAAQTHFVLASDIELFPSADFIPAFLGFVASNPDLFSPQNPNSSVFVLPVFELLANETVPQTKTELQNLTQDGRALWFHQNTCSSCHKVPRGDQWLEEPEQGGMNVFAVAKREGVYRLWEPFYVGTKKEPIFDERFVWEGESNKLVQAFEMCLLGYDYMILNNAFLVHKPGVKLHKDQKMKYMDVVEESNKVFKLVKWELKEAYKNRSSGQYNFLWCS